jgi:hypothetical protein
MYMCCLYVYWMPFWLFAVNGQVIDNVWLLSRLCLILILGFWSPIATIVMSRDRHSQFLQIGAKWVRHFSCCLWNNEQLYKVLPYSLYVSNHHQKPERAKYSTNIKQGTWMGDSEKQTLFFWWDLKCLTGWRVKRICYRVESGMVRRLIANYLPFSISKNW